ncbi:hypothetical protein FB451DRAFT_1226325 [Mycena latifolia]|nr:hypothetical protein FB451DRAFT_1226325 [Mycena latifolia]
MHAPSEEDDGEDRETDASSESASEGDSSTISSFNETRDMPDRSFRPMPARLTLPVELHRLVLSETDQHEEMWGTYRFVCKAWKEQVEFLAKTEWIRDATFFYPGSRMWDPEIGNVLLDGLFSFLRLEEDLALFEIADCDPKYREALADACSSVSRPDVGVGPFIHDVEIPGMSVDWDSLTLTCPWRTIIGRVLAEELRVVEYRGHSHQKMMNTAKRMRRAAGGDVGLDGMMELFEMFGKIYDVSYIEVRKARLGRTDERGDERLKMARFGASM